MLGMHGSVLATVRGGNMNAYTNKAGMTAALGAGVAADYPGGSPNGIPPFLSYYRYPHLAATAWTGMLLLYQAEDGGPVNESSNPYAPPKRSVPSAAAGVEAAATCLPAHAKASHAATVSPGSAACSAHPKCKG